MLKAPGFSPHPALLAPYLLHPGSKDFPPHVASAPAQPPVPSLTTVPLNVPVPIAATAFLPLPGPLSWRSWTCSTPWLPEPVGEDLSWRLRAPRATLKLQISSPGLPGHMHQNPGRPPKMSEDTAPPRIRRLQLKLGANPLILVLLLGGGAENVWPPAGKTALSDHGVHVPAKQGFDIYMDEPEQGDRDSCVGQERMVFEEPYEVDTSTLNSDLHFLLDFNTVSPMLVDSSLHPQPEDASDFGTDVINVTEYAEEIHQYLREAEVRHRPKAHYMKKQPDITEGMRTILVDWLVEVGEEYKLRAETLYLAVNFLDRFLSCMSVLRGKLQLVGTAAILLASKYEEIYPPEVDEFVYITDDTYTKRQLLRMEHLLLKVLAFDLTVPTTNQFLLQYLRRQGVCVRTENLAKYVAELSLLEADPFLKYLPSLIAAAAYCLANYTVNRHFWGFLKQSG
ncbi:cyclin-A1-like protein [Camelus ferus]|nr:cyclin-A1-like protein [Camelus ferus]